MNYGTLFTMDSDDLRTPEESDGHDVCVVIEDTSCIADSWISLVVVPAG